MLPDILICDDSGMTRKQMTRVLPTALPDGPKVNVEMLMDMFSVLFGTSLKGVGDQMNLWLSLSLPTVLHRADSAGRYG
jgi:hypothetical protein